MDKDFGKYGQKFQLGVLSLFIQDKSFASKVIEIIKPEYFDNIYTKWFCQTITEQITQFKSPPTFNDLKLLIETSFPSNSQLLYITTLNNIKEADITRREFIEFEVNKFCLTKHALAKIEEEKALVISGEFDKARSIALNIYRPLNHDIQEIDLKTDYKILFNGAKHFPISTPLPSVNKISQGGPGAGDLCVVVAQSNLGKTAYLTALARYNALQGNKVVYFSLETKGEQILSRAVAGLLGINQELLSEHPRLIEKRIQEIPGNIKFVRIKATQAKVEVMKSIVDRYKAEGFFTNLIIIDGLNQVKPPRTERFSNSNDKFEYLAEEIRDWAGEIQVPSWVAFQGNRCLALNTIVETKRGKIEIKDLTLEDEILTHKGYKKVLKIYPVETQPVYKIKLKSGKEIICSGNHYFPVSTLTSFSNINDGLVIGSKLFVKKTK